jgi:hypothetical protein
VRVLFDQGTPVPLRRLLGSHQVETAFERRWHTLINGELLAAAERYGFDILMTTDKKLRYQQSSSGRSIAIIVLCVSNLRDGLFDARPTCGRDAITNRDI